MHVTDEQAQRLGLGHLSNVERNIALAHMYATPLCANEIMLAIMGVEVVQFSDTVLYISSQPPRRAVSNHAITGTCRGKPMQTHHMQYMLRPHKKYTDGSSDMDDLAFEPYFQQYELIPQSRARALAKHSPSHADKIDMEDNAPFIIPSYCPIPGRERDYVGRDDAGNIVLRYNRDVVVRFTDISPQHDLEGFAYGVLMRSYPHRYEAQLYRDDVPSFVYTCQQLGYFQTPDNISHHLDLFFDRNFCTADLSQDIRAQVLETFDEDTLHHAQPMTDNNPDMVTLMNDLKSELQSQVAGKPATAEQRHVIDQVRANPFGFVIVSGGGGVGKSITVRHIALDLLNAGRIVHLTATTATAANLLSKFATTCHSGFNIATSFWSHRPSTILDHQLSHLACKRRLHHRRDVLAHCHCPSNNFQSHPLGTSPRFPT